MKFTILTGALSWLLFLFISPVVIPLLLAFWLGRFLAHNLGKIIKFKNSGTGIQEPVTSLDQLFTLGDFYTNSRGSNLLVLVLEGPIDLRKVQSKFQEVLLNTKGYDRLHSLRPIVWLGYTFWTSASSNPAVSLRSSFQVQDHFRTETTEIRGDASLDKYLAKYLRRPYSIDRPCWDAVYIPNFRQDPNSNVNKSVFVFRGHHIAGDGISFSLLMHKITEAFPPGQEANSATTEAYNSILKKQEELRNKNNPVLLSKDTLKMLIGGLQNAFWTPLMCLHQVNEFKFQSSFLTKEKSTQECVVLRSEMPLEEFKTIRRQHFDGTPLSSLATQNWILAGALREHYKRQFGVAAVDPSLPSPSVLSSMPWTGSRLKRNVSKFHNQFTIGYFKLPLYEPCRLKRRDAIIQDCRNIAKFRLPHVYRNLLPVCGLFPFFIVKNLVGKHVGVLGQVGTVIGPPGPVYLDGKKVDHACAVTGVQFPHSGMVNIFGSYNGRMTSSFFFNKELLPSGDTAGLDKDLKDEFAAALASKN